MLEESWILEISWNLNIQKILKELSQNNFSKVLGAIQIWNTMHTLYLSSQMSANLASGTKQQS
jgi:hypothetical protein